MKTAFLAVPAVLMLLGAANGSAQDTKEDSGPVGIFPSRGEYIQFMGSAKELAYGPGGTAELQAMIPMLNDIALNQPIGSTAGQYDVEGNIMGLLSDDKIRAELEMVDHQYEDFQRASATIQTRMAAQIRQLDFQDPDKLVQRIRTLQRQAQDELDSVLLPHQLTRLRQIQIQSQLRRRSLVDVLTRDPVRSELDITDAQSDELRETEREIEAELQQEIARLRQRARDRLLSKLSRSQKERVESMIGDSFDFASRGSNRKSQVSK